MYDSLITKWLKLYPQWIALFEKKITYEWDTKFLKWYIQDNSLFYERLNKCQHIYALNKYALFFKEK